MRAILLLLSITLLPACAHQEPMPGPTRASLEGAPTWVTARPRATIVDGKRWFLGVGMAESRKPTGGVDAEEASRQAALRSLDSFCSHIMWFSWQDGGNPDAKEPAEITQIRELLRRSAERVVSSAQIADRWTSRDATRLFVLSRLDADTFFQEVMDARELNERKRDVLRARWENAFDEVKAEADAIEPRP